MGKPSTLNWRPNSSASTATYCNAREIQFCKPKWWYRPGGTSVTWTTRNEPTQALASVGKLPFLCLFKTVKNSFNVRLPRPRLTATLKKSSSKAKISCVNGLSERTGWNFSKAQTTFAAGRGSGFGAETDSLLTLDKFAIEGKVSFSCFCKCLLCVRLDWPIFLKSKF